jgi:hypothetical protein
MANGPKYKKMQKSMQKIIKMWAGHKNKNKFVLRT